ncbi:MAG: pyruvate dehydrogenase (acetyl-transferring), homodimeric type [Fimbriimonadaceae bacterium]|nr:pyruvate dehydrogenase (acetyl-transferring), homodimeric type [Fimbriimonadaceae bacterium]
MADQVMGQGDDLELLETRDWVDALHDVLLSSGPERVTRLLEALQIHAQNHGAVLPVTSQTPYVNTIPAERQPAYPGNREIERRIKSIVRWNAMAMVVRANRAETGIGGHISTYASAATLYEVGFNHFFRGPDHPCGGDLIYFQGHATPGIYARAFLEGRLNRDQVLNFRRELQPGGGLSSYPHPWLMPKFWQFPTVSMGLGPIMSIYQARYMRYLQDRGLIDRSDAKVWAFLGDGETDEPESLGAITLASREGLDNLVWVINCNLQRLDGPVRGNGNIVQELEAILRGAGWNVIKVLWGTDWDPLLAADSDGLLAKRFGEIVDGEYQKYRVEGGAYIRERFFGVDPRLLKLVEHLSDKELWRLRLGGHDADKVYAAYHAATHHVGAPTVILAQTIKGYGLGEAGEGKNITHQQKKLNEDELLHFRDRFQIPISDADVGDLPLYVPPAGSIELEYLRDRRRALGGAVPQRRPVAVNLQPGDATLYDEFAGGTGDRDASTTMVFVRLLTKLLKDPQVGQHVVPIVPDEARTFGMESLFRQVGIYASGGQLYEPVDRESLMYYKEAQNGQILEEGITEAGAMSSFIAAGTAHANHHVPTIPFFIYYSMFGFQRVGDLIWLAGDIRCRGFLLGGTAGRTTLAGEGLQHQDGHSHLLASTIPNVQAYDPAYAYEIAVIIEDGIRRMYQQEEDVFYYLTLSNENYAHPAIPSGAREGILRGLYQLRPTLDGTPAQVVLLGSGSILNEVVAAQERLAAEFGVAAEVWSATSYKRLREDALEVERWNLLHPAEPPRVPYVTQCLAGRGQVVVAASDYMKVLSDGLTPWVPQPLLSLGTDGFGRSESRADLRDFFEVDARYVAAAALSGLARTGGLPAERAAAGLTALGIDPERPNPWTR